MLITTQIARSAIVTQNGWLENRRCQTERSLRPVMSSMATLL